VGTTKVILRGATDVTLVAAGTKVRVAVAGNRWSAVIVGTGESRAACSVAMRSCGVPVAGISQINCLRMFSSMGGMDEGYAASL
jgi:hypothetical protein